jgi:intracellular multiplication protein IcmL
MSDDALELVRMRNNFYRDNYRRAIAALLLMVLVNLLLVAGVIYQMVNRPHPQYFATTADGKLIQLSPLNDPMVSQEFLLQWANQAAVAAYTYDFVNYRQQLQKASEYFTPEGWKNFQDILKQSKNLNTVIDQKLTVNAVATGAPVITQRGILNGRFAWKVQIPLLVTYQNPNRVINQSVLVNMIITRVSVLDFPRGIAIAEYLAGEQPLGAGQ